MRAEWYTITSRCTRKLGNTYFKIWAWSCILFVSTRISKGSVSEEDRNRIGIVENQRYDTTGRKIYQRWNVSRDPLKCKSQQEIHERLWQARSTWKIMTYVLRC